MKPTTIIGLALVVATSAAHATDVSYDFTAPGPDQTGAYMTSTGAVAAAGTGTLRAVGTPDWVDPSQRVRVPFAVHNPGAPLPEYPVRITLDGVGAPFLRWARDDGADIRIVDAAGMPVQSWLESADGPALQAAAWFRVPLLASGDTQLFAYAGNGIAPSADNTLPFFTFPMPVQWAFAANTASATASLSLVTLVDANHYMAATQTGVLVSGAPTTLAPGSLLPETAIATEAPVAAAFGAGGGDAVIPLALASTDFVEPTGRCVDAFTIVAPTLAADVTVSDGAVMVAMQHVAAGGSATFTADVADMHVVAIHSTAPVLVHHNAAGCDVVDYPPPSVDLYGANGGTGIVAARTAATVHAYYSDGTTNVLTIAAGTAVALACNGTEGSGCAVHLVSDAPIGAISYADGDGGDAEAFLDRSALGRLFAVPADAQYLHVATSQPGTTCVLRDPAGGMVSTSTSGTLAPPYPNNLFFGGSDNLVHITAGSTLSCNAPVWVVYEGQADEQEKNLWPVQFHRPFAPSEPTISFGAHATRYGSRDEWISTPVYTPPRRVIAWLGFDDTDVAIPAGAAVAYQISTDGGASWQKVVSGRWAPSSGALLDEASSGGDIDAAMPLLSASSVAVRAILRGVNGVEAPALHHLRIGVQLAPPLGALILDPIASPQTAVAPFGIHVVALDTTGSTDIDVNGDATILSDAGSVSVVSGGSFVRGVMDARIAIYGSAPAAHVVVQMLGTTGTSNPFALQLGTAAALVGVSGDGQYAAVGAMLPGPLVVRATTSTGAPAPGVAVSFRADVGGGRILPSETLTDSAGLAQAMWTLGTVPGTNHAVVIAAGTTDTVAFVARGDAPGAADAGDGGSNPHPPGTGCGCRTAGGTGTPGEGAWIALVAACAVLVRRRPLVRV